MLEELEPDFLQSALNALPSGILVTDERGRILFANPETLRIFGYTADELLGLPVETLLPDTHRSAHVVYRQQYLQQPTPRPMGAGRELFGHSKDGEPVPLEIGLRPFHRDNETLVIASIVDVSARNQLESKLRKATQEAEERADHIREFTRGVSHDLSAPLRSIAGFVQILKSRYSEVLDAEAMELVDHTVEAVKAMSSLLDDLTVLLTTGTRPPVFESVDLVELVQSVLGIIDFELKALDAEVTYSGLVPVIGERVQLVRLFQNLLENCLKFSGRPPLRVAIEGQLRGEQLEIFVTDNGIGIPEGDHKAVFDMFFRSNGPRFPGTGIGLANCKRIAERHGGTIWVQSSSSSGTVIGLTLKPSD